MFEEVKDTQKALAARINLGSAVYSLDRLSDAKAHWEAALQLAQQSNSHFTGTIFMDLALLETKRGDYPKAREYTEQAMKWQSKKRLRKHRLYRTQPGEMLTTELESLAQEKLEARLH